MPQHNLHTNQKNKSVDCGSDAITIGWENQWPMQQYDNMVSSLWNDRWHRITVESRVCCPNITQMLSNPSTNCQVECIRNNSRLLIVFVKMINIWWQTVIKHIITYLYTHLYFSFYGSNRLQQHGLQQIGTVLILHVTRTTSPQSARSHKYHRHIADLTNVPISQDCHMQVRTASAAADSSPAYGTSVSLM